MSRSFAPPAGLILLLMSAAASGRSETVASVAAAPQAIRTLAEAYAAARRSSETVAISEAAGAQAEAPCRRTLGSSFPELSLQSRTFSQDVRPYQGQTDAGVRLLQSNLTFYREFFAVKQSKATEKQREQDLARAEQNLLVSVAAA